MGDEFTVKSFSVLGAEFQHVRPSAHLNPIPTLLMLEQKMNVMFGLDTKNYADIERFYWDVCDYHSRCERYITLPLQQIALNRQHPIVVNYGNDVDTSQTGR